ncbi:hypothetical protein EHEL_070390 [Encephalitozoon hellem ATCC 50504]|uniref:Uncharacterized protein n=1 Tax=Encephalitozoon hellem TaxID=27973 RepID=A0A9Q9F8D7_ENCHE|nr:uncharacterized protein EHEL_070390 [Encephalitozoon hellem ATCC 50504]AFM98566.1 hypothetical protein EHEL_070390 [Encephalitozoon hellem ATCC 50504]UTX43509.1 hypothetical protein GPU96_07g12680 [Encephalitozoon hellem]|eukprot:XP_003887547.1 hypothetical protein EHEL_070390 [Encephalitozoon hellem ATCC 50504]
MVFCIGTLWNVVPCRGKASQKVMKSTYLKSYETLQSEDDSNFLLDNDEMGEVLTRNGSWREGDRGSERKISRKAGRGASNVSSEVSIGEGKKQRPRSNSAISNDGFWSDSYEDMSGEVESRNGSKEKKKSRERHDKKESRGNRRVPSEEVKSSRRSSKSMDMASKKSEILEKYRSRIYNGEKGHYSPDDISKESEVESSDYREEEKNPRGTSRQRLDRYRDSRAFERDSSHNPDDSESEITFIMDIYDKSSLNNSLREKMFEYLSQMGKKS